MYVHAFALVGEGPPNVGIDVGALGVSMFFAISGFLVARSWCIDQRFFVFAAKRLLRLLPALLLTLAVTAYVVGPLFTEDPATYLSDSQTHSYVLENATFREHYLLPGVFTGNPEPGVVNGNLWTLPVEAKAYLGLALLGMLGLVAFWPLAAAVIGVLALVVNDIETGPSALAVEVVRVLGGGVPGARLVAIFAGGVLLYALRSRLRLHLALFLAAVAAVCLAPDAGILRLVSWSIAMPYLVVYLAYATPAVLRRVARPGDVSYGMYLNGFVIQQALVAGTGITSGWLLLAVSGPLSYLAGLASWRLVESPALALKARLPGRTATAPPGAGSPDVEHRQAPVSAERA